MRLQWLAAVLFFHAVSAHGQMEHLNLSYVKGDSIDSLRMINLVLPDGAGPFPLLIWIGGGAWSYVDRHQEMGMARNFASDGIAVASVGHRLSNPIWQNEELPIGIQHPAHVRDVAKAIRWLIDHAADFSYTKEKIFIGGFSSGAHISALLCSNEKYLSEVGLSQADLQGVIPVSGTYDIFDYHHVFKNGTRPEMAQTHVEAIFGSGDLFEDASPVTFVDQLRTPMLLISDTRAYNYTKLYEEKLREASFPDFEVLHVQQLGHAELWRDMSDNEESIYRKHVANFILREASS